MHTPYLINYLHVLSFKSEDSPRPSGTCFELFIRYIIFLTFSFKDLFYAYGCFACMCVDQVCNAQKARRRNPIPMNWSYSHHVDARN